MRLEKDRDGCPKIINLGASRTDLFYERRRLGESSLSLSPFVMRRWTDSSFIRVQLERRAKYTCCFISYICSPSTLAGYYRFFFRAMAR